MIDRLNKYAVLATRYPLVMEAIIGTGLSDHAELIEDHDVMSRYYMVIGISEAEGSYNLMNSLKRVDEARRSAVIELADEVLDPLYAPDREALKTASSDPCSGYMDLMREDMWAISEKLVSNAVMKANKYIAEKLSENHKADIGAAVTRRDELMRKGEGAFSTDWKHEHRKAAAMGEPQGFSTGIQPLDNMEFPFMHYEGGICIIGGQPGAGKTTFVNQLLTQFLAETDYTACYMSMEYNAQKMRKYWLPHLRYRYSMDDEGVADWWDTIELKWMSECHDVNDMIAEIDRLKRNNPKLKLLIIDYIQQMGDRECKYSGDAAASVNTKLPLANKRWGISIIVLSQLDKASFRAAGKVELASAKGAGELIQNAQSALFLTMDDAEKRKQIKRVKCCIEKDRDGGVRDCEIDFDGINRTFE